MTDQHTPAARSNDAHQSATADDDMECWDYIDGTTSFSRPSVNGKSLFACVQEKTNLAHQSSEVYQLAIRRVIERATAEAVGVSTIGKYKTASVWQIDSGELLVRRVPMESAPNMQPVSVDVTAQMVIDEYREILQRRHNKPADVHTPAGQ
ncbi:hypothetical protein [Candidimonas nitroreducens]|uniref:Uncharacterized protein n=1 Tax=Candidimonas nitroreducens TaxID=683354 RepID=A0A225MLN1_9BURK|nr:hypothetical protein [Candidimonas nitroreducens]OWT61872.1 hypothetical protein CEY11_08550 [Candidimonas nitroreducens]